MSTPTTNRQEVQLSIVKLRSKLTVAETTGGAKLHTREKEEATLREAFQRTITDGQQELILISGQRGSGKTALANTLRQSVSKAKGYFVVGKFEEYAVQEPYEVFITALTDYVDQLVGAADEALLARIQGTVQNIVGSGGALPFQILPALNRILGDNAILDAESHSGVVNFKSLFGGSNKSCYTGVGAQNRFRIIFCSLVRSLAVTSPLVLLLNDLQWADTASMELVRNLMHEEHMPLLILGAHRSDLDKTLTAETTADPKQVVCCIACMQMRPFVDAIKALEKESVRDNLRMHTIDLENLNAAAVSVLLHDLMDQKTEQDTLPLAEFVVQQTDGNLFHVLQFVRLLLDQGFLKRTVADKWTWDCQEFGPDPHLCSLTILDLVRQTVEGLPRLAQEVLKVASCMGDEIDDSALDLVLQTATAKHLEQAAAEVMLVFFSQYGGYRFANDLVRQTAYEMTLEEDRDEFHLKIARRLWKGSSAVAIERNIFVLVPLFNRAQNLIKEENERYKVAELNLRAAQKAAAISAFPDASKFAQQGIRLLGSRRWNDYYELSLSLFSLASEVEAINGHYHRVVVYIEEIVKNAACLEDKLRAYAAWIRSMGQQDNLSEATTVGIALLRQLEPFPSRPTKFSILKELLKVRMALRGKTDHDLLNIPRMNDPIKTATLHILNLIFMSGYLARSPYTSLVAFRSIILTLKYGMNETSSVAFAAYGVILCGLGLDVTAGRRYGAVAISMADKMQSRDHLPMVHYLVGCGIHHWTRPISETFDCLLFASRSAMEAGDVETAVMSKLFKNSHAFFTGTKIEDCEEGLERCISSARIYRKRSAEVISLLHLQMFHCYAGKSKNPARLSGDAITFDYAMQDCVESNNWTWVSCIFLFSLELAYNFRDFEFANTMAEKIRGLKKNPSASFLAVETRYKEGLTAIASARKGENTSKNKKIGKQMLKKMTTWARMSPGNYRQKQLLLDAELRSLKGAKQKSKVYAIYEEAIKCAEARNYLNELALIYERFSDFKELCGDHKDALTLYEKAIATNQYWGAIAKCEQLTDLVSQLDMNK